MDAQIADLFYYITVGAPIRKMTKTEKFTDSWDKILQILFNVKPKSKKSSGTGEKTSSLSKSEIEKLQQHITFMTGLYEDVVVKYFSDRKYLLDLTEESREMRKKLYESGSLDRVSLAYPEPNDLKQTNITIDIHSLNGSGIGGTVNIGPHSVNILHSGEKYKLTDTLVGFSDGQIYIFKAESLKNIDIQANLTPINWNIPLHTQVYRFFHPDSFNVGQIKATQSMIAEHGLEYVIKLFVKEIYHFHRQ